MPNLTLVPADLTPFADIEPTKATAMIEDALALAMLAAPCLAEADLAYDKAAAAKAVLRGAILRWNDSGTGAYTSEMVGTGPFQHQTVMDTRQARRSMFWPSEIAQLQDICKGALADTGAFSIDTAPGAACVHSEACAVMFGAAYCSCGADIAGFPLYEPETSDP